MNFSSFYLMRCYEDLLDAGGELANSVENTRHRPRFQRRQRNRIGSELKQENWSTTVQRRRCFDIYRCERCWWLINSLSFNSISIPVFVAVGRKPHFVLKWILSTMKPRECFSWARRAHFYVIITFNCTSVWFLFRNQITTLLFLLY